MRKMFHALAMASLVAALPAAGHSQSQGGKVGQARAFPNLTTIYRIDGVRDDGGAPNEGGATVVHCTNFKGSNAEVQYIVRQQDGSLLAKPKVTIGPRATRTASTHAAALFKENRLLTPGTAIGQGSMLIKATTAKVHCTAMIIDAGAGVPME